MNIWSGEEEFWIAKQFLGCALMRHSRWWCALHVVFYFVYLFFPPSTSAVHLFHCEKLFAQCKSCKWNEQRTDERRQQRRLLFFYVWKICTCTTQYIQHTTYRFVKVLFPNCFPYRIASKSQFVQLVPIEHSERRSGNWW